MEAEPDPDEIDQDALAELEQDLGDDFPDFVARFLSSAEEAVDSFGHALGVGEAAKVALQAHALKGTAGYLGAMALAKVLGELQVLAEFGDLGRAKEAAERARALLQAARPFLRRRAGLF